MHRLIAAQLLTMDVLRFLVGLQTRTGWDLLAAVGTYDHLIFEHVNGVLTVLVMADDVELASCTWTRDSKKVLLLDYKTIEDLAVIFPDDMVGTLLDASAKFGDEFVLETNLIRSTADAGAVEGSIKSLGNIYQEYQIVRTTPVAFKVLRSSGVYNKNIRPKATTR